MSDSTSTTGVSVIGDPAPLGLAGLGFTLGLLSFHNSGLVKEAALVGITTAVAVIFGGLVSILMSMWEYRRGNTFSATFFGALGAYWLSSRWGSGSVMSAVGGGDAHTAMGLYFLGWTLVAAYLTIAAMKTSGTTMLTTLGLTATWLFLALGQLQNKADPDSLTKVGGWIGLVTAAIALYGSFAGVANETHGKQVLPTWPR
jgi:succinate-acetate transporter protein